MQYFVNSVVFRIHFGHECLSGIYLELKQSILVAQSHQMETKHVGNMVWNKDPADVEVTPRKSEEIC